MSKGKRWLAVAALAGGIIAAGIGISQAEPMSGAPFCGHHHGGMGMGMGGPMFGMHFHGIKLTEQQKDQLFKLAHDMEPTFYQKMKALRQSRESLREAESFANYQPQRVRQLLDTQAKQHAELEALHSELKHKMFAVLTPDQQKQVIEHEKQHPWNMHGDADHDGIEQGEIALSR
jgi:Spy/CpxP family protein refolding chaperone